MKLTKLMLSACVAALALVSCNKEEGPSVKSNYKSVEIEINNLFMTKSQGDMIADGTPVVLNDVRIYLTDGNRILNTAKDITGADLTPADYQFTAAQVQNQTIEYHFVDPAVNKVVALANLTDEQYAAVTDYASIQALKLDIAKQQDETALALYAEDALEAAGEQHIPTGDTHKPGENTITDLYKAELKLVPRVARFELDGFAMLFYADAAKARYNKITISQVALNNYYPATALWNGVEEGTLVDCKAENQALAVNYLTGNVNGNADWYFDIFATPVEFVRPASMTADEWVNVDMAEDYYYHIFPGTADPENAGYPELMFQLATEDVDGATSATYIYTKSLKNSAGEVIKTFEDGKIYRMNFAGAAGGDGDGDIPIKEDDIDQLGRCLDITVTVEDWNVVLVSPEF